MVKAVDKDGVWLIESFMPSGGHSISPECWRGPREHTVLLRTWTPDSVPAEVAHGEST